MTLRRAAMSNPDPPVVVVRGRPARCRSALLASAALGLITLVACGPSNVDSGAVTTVPSGQSGALAFADPDTDGGTEPGQAAENGDPAMPPVTAGSGLPPVTTIPGPFGTGSLDGYNGLIGRLAPDEQVADPVTLPPARADGVMPLTGLRGDVPSRPAAVVKIDNGAGAIPQTGLNAADIVIEEEVEGGVTRFAAVFHSTSSIVGPVRSGRTTDVALISGLGSPLFLYSGANDLTETILRRQPHIQNRSHATSSGYWRDEDRRAPSNLYTDTAPHWASALGVSPPPQFAFRRPGEAVSGTAAATFSIDYPLSAASWEWVRDRWVRYQRGQRHDLVDGEPISAANVVVIEADRVGTGMFDSAGGPVPEFVFVGSGPATVFTDGRRVEGVWTRPTLTSVATLTTSVGAVIELTPGRTWIQLIERGSGYLR